MTTRRSPAKIIPQAFPGITPEEVAELIAHSRLQTYPPEMILCHENAVEHTFYIILEGEVEVTKIINEAETRLLKVLRPGDFFGEMALIHNAPRAATVKSITRLIVLEIDRESFDQALKCSSSISLAMVREISHRLRENDEMAIDDLRIRARELAEAYQKLAEQEVTRREFLTSIAHELRTPLMAASGYLQLLQKGAIPAEQLNPIMDIIARNVNQIISLVNDILFIQEMELILGKFQAVDMLETAEAVKEEFHAKAIEQGVSLKIVADQDLPLVSGDSKHLGRALSALVDNAIKFSPNGGVVMLRLYSERGQVVISVKDQGIGIEPERLPHIFDRFYHLDRSTSGDQVFSGLGLGLAITKQVIEQHHGHLGVESQLDKGTTFTIRLGAWQKGNGDTITT